LRLLNLSFQRPCNTSHSLISPRVFFSNAFNYIIKPGFGAAIGRTFFIISNPSFRDIFLSFIKYARVKLVALDFPAKQ
jgi:hypothetical protein